MEGTLVQPQTPSTARLGVHGQTPHPSTPAAPLPAALLTLTKADPAFNSDNPLAERSSRFGFLITIFSAPPDKEDEICRPRQKRRGQLCNYTIHFHCFENLEYF